MKFLLLLLVSFSLFSVDIGYFHPPKEWQEGDPKKMEKYVLMGYFKKSGNSIPPSINLAREEIGNMNLSGYVKAVGELYAPNKHSQWRKLGKFKTKAGTAELTEIIRKTQMGDLQILQMLFVKDGAAFVLTGAALKDEFSSVRGEIIKAFRSFKVTEDLIHELSQEEKEIELRDKMKVLQTLCKDQKEKAKVKKKEIMNFHSYLTKEHEEMGAYWQYLILKELSDSILEKKE